MVRFYRHLMDGRTTVLSRVSVNDPWEARCKGWQREYLKYPVGKDKPQARKYFASQPPMEVFLAWLTTKA